MSNKILKIIFWFLFFLSVFTMTLSAGLFLAVSLIIIIPLLILHIKIGIRISRLKKFKYLILLSALNLFIFSLIRPDGVHVTTQTGIESLFDFFGLYIRLNEEHHLYTWSIALVSTQLLIDIILLLLSKKNIDKII